MTDKRHYDVESLHKDYKQVYSLMMKVLMIGVGGALVYFFIFIVYLGGWSHTKAADYAKTFNERYPQDYKGLKLPEFGGPAAPEPKHHAKEEAHGDAHAAPVTEAVDAHADVTPSVAPVAAETTVSATVAPTAEEHHEEQGTH